MKLYRYTPALEIRSAPSVMMNDSYAELVAREVRAAAFTPYRDFPTIAPDRILAIDPVALPDNLASEWTAYNFALGSAYNFALGSARRPNRAATAVAEMPAPIKKPERDEILRREPVRAEDMPADVDAMQSDLAMEAERLLGYSVMRTRLKLPDPLLAALAQLEIEPYNGASVAQYKQEMLAYAQNEARRMDVAEGIDPDSYNARRASWSTRSLDGYAKPVPEFALDKALQIKRACPAATFEIEELTIVPDPFLIVIYDTQLGYTRRYIEVWDEPKFEAQNLTE
jgi:hypothetical protein